MPLLEDVLQLHGHLLLDGEHRRWQQPLDAQLLALGVREGGVSVLRRVAKYLLAARPVDVRGRLWVHSLQYKGQFKISLRPWGIAPLRKAAIPPGQYSIPIVLGNLFPLASGLLRVNCHSFRFSCRPRRPLNAVRRPDVEVRGPNTVSGTTSSLRSLPQIGRASCRERV